MNKYSTSSYTDDNTLYRTVSIIDGVIKSLEYYSIRFFEWFSDDDMKTTISKCHL